MQPEFVASIAQTSMFSGKVNSRQLDPEFDGNSECQSELGMVIQGSMQSPWSIAGIRAQIDV